MFSIVLNVFNEIEFNTTEGDKYLCISSIMHAADISNPFKPFRIY